MAAYDIHKHFKALRVDTGRRRRNPFDTGFEDEIGDQARARSTNKPTAKSPDKKPKPATAAKPASPNNARDRDSEDEFLNTPKSKLDRRVSPAPDQLAASLVSEGAARRPPIKKTASEAKRSLTAKAQAGGILAYLDESEEEDDDSALSPPSRSRHDRRPSPSPRKGSDAISPGRRSSTPRGEKENHAQPKLAPPRHTVASPFAGTKYLQDSDDEDLDNEEAVSSRTNSQDDTYDSDLEGLGPLFHTSRARTTEIKRVDKPKPQQGGGVSWRAFSEGRADQRTAEIALLQATLRKRGKSISFSAHAVTDDGERIPLLLSTDVPSGPNSKGLKGKRGRSPPRRASDVEPTADEVADGFERYDPAHFKTNPFTGKLMC
jgi:hypothetical protein